jgi:L-ascorbate metabolism protein UlaG (beta-lactamase superfamily)
VRTPVGSVYFAGDTGLGPHFADLRRRYGAVRYALLPIGCYEPRWFMRAYHMSPEDAVSAHQDLGAETSIGIHFGTFRLGDEGIDAPAHDLARVLRARGLEPEAFQVLAFGVPFAPLCPAPAAAVGTVANFAQSGVVLTEETW